jgi:hypothetical protein
VNHEVDRKGQGFRHSQNMSLEKSGKGQEVPSGLSDVIGFEIQTAKTAWLGRCSKMQPPSAPGTDGSGMGAATMPPAFRYHKAEGSLET